MLRICGQNFDVCCFKEVAFTSKRNWFQFCFVIFAVLLCKIGSVAWSNRNCWDMTIFRFDRVDRYIQSPLRGEIPPQYRVIWPNFKIWGSCTYPVTAQPQNLKIALRVYRRNGVIGVCAARILSVKISNFFVPRRRAMSESRYIRCGDKRGPCHSWTSEIVSHPTYSFAVMGCWKIGSIHAGD